MFNWFDIFLLSSVHAIRKKPRYFFVVIIILFIPLNICAQGYYPLEIGNIWEYYDIYEPQHGFTIRAIRDTVMPNGLRYTVTQSDWGIGSIVYLRQSGSKVYSYSSFLDSEELWYDFSKTTGDTVAILYTLDDTVVITVMSDDTVEVFGELRRQWVFHWQWLNYSMYIIEAITDGLGMTFSETEPAFRWWLRGALIDGTQYGTLDANISNSSVPEDYKLLQNYPNPFNSSTIIKLKLPEEAYIVATILDVMGRQVRKLFSGKADVGLHEIVWDGCDDSGRKVGSGIYIYTVQTRNFVSSMKMILLR